MQTEWQVNCLFDSIKVKKIEPDCAKPEENTISKENLKKT